MVRKPFDTFILTLLMLILIIQMVYQVINIGKQTGFDAAYYNYNETGLFVSIASGLLFLIGGLYTVAKLKTLYVGRNGTVIFTLLYFIFACVMSFLAYPYGPKIFAKALINPTVAPLMMVVFYILAKDNPIDEKYTKILFILVPFVLIIPFTFLYRQYEFYSVNMKFTYAYYAMYALPMILIIRHKTFRMFMVLFCITFLVFASKRTGIVATLFSAYLFFFIQNIFIERRNKALHMTFLPIFVLISAGIVFYINLRTEGFLSNLFDFDTISESNLNGRLDLWEMALSAFRGAPFLKEAFGQGAYVFTLEAMDIIGFAHNDFLSTLVYYGVVGFSLLTCSIILLARKCLILIRKRSQYAAALSAGGSILFLCMNFSIVYYMPSVTMFIFCSIGYLLGLSDNEKQRILPYGQ